jgi:hypothetical protein
MISKSYLTTLTFLLCSLFAAGQVTDAEKTLRAVNADTLMGWKKGGVISLNLNTVLLYDDDIKVPVDRNGNGIFESSEAPGPRTQFKEIFGVGFSYKF